MKNGIVNLPDRHACNLQSQRKLALTPPRAAAEVTRRIQLGTHIFRLVTLAAAGEFEFGRRSLTPSPLSAGHIQLEIEEAGR